MVTFTKLTDEPLLSPAAIQHLVPGAIEVRVPAIAQVGTSEILVACDARLAPVDDDWAAIGGAMAADLPNPNSLLLLRGRLDATIAGGISWAEPTVLRQGSIDPRSGFSDPAIITSGNRVVIAHARSADVGFFGSGRWCDNPAGNDARNVLHIDVACSDDAGKSWSISTITGDVAREFSGAFVTSGHGVIAANGDWVFPMIARNLNGTTSFVAAISTDAGQTWESGQPIGIDMDETALATIGTRLLLSARSTSAYASGKLGRWQAESTDFGRSWQDLAWDNSLPAAACNAALVELPGTIALSYAGPDRIGGHIAVLDDDTWRTVATITDQAFGYSDALYVEGNLIVVYEQSGSLRMATYRTRE
ncbi:BNR repeat-like domain [Corynebacterium mustelae]|uniref:exo-alpha-sialidase n=1 Tax=Corynebacterium mustelae TaxID=571915 RepID=A0A0G3GZW3_9CORY|nr:sialidase family protein [Corynebacterium mustelae]AKK06671.1 BNR repeat-like domain [Corynebacterium mustelae]